MQKSSKQNFKIVLIGVEFEENLSLRYLAGALIHAGYSQVVIKPYNSILQAEEIVDYIINEKSDLVGISMAFQVRAVEDMAIVQLLRKRGFQNHITAGGQFATLHYDDIFKDCPGLNSVVRFEAESAIVELADVILNSADLHNVTGLVWKDENNFLHQNPTVPSPTDINDLPLPLRKSERLEFLGLKNIQMIGSRGCHATCKYCCVSALATERRTASRDSGAATAIPGTRRRTAASVASEIAHLYFKHDIRIFEFQDDNWIHPKISVAVEYFTELKNELEKRAVGKIGLTLKTRADSVQPEIIKVLKEIGLIRVFVGIESGTQNLLSKLGRKSRDNVSLQALQVLRDFKIPAYFNALLFGPDIRFEEIEPELEFLEQCTDFPFEIVEVVIYGKTGLYLSLSQEKRLRGNYLDYDYDYLDPKTQDTHAMISNLETRHFGVYSPIKMAADLGFNLGIMQVFYPGEITDQLALKVSELNKKINLDQVRIIRTAAQFASAGIPLEKAREELIAETISLDLQFYSEIIELHKQMEVHVSSITRQDDVSSYYRVGAIVQSGLIASLFILLSGTANAQSSGRISDGLEKQLVDLMYKPRSKEWKSAVSQLRTVKTPVFNYYSWVNHDVDSINTKKRKINDKVSTENLRQLHKEVTKLQKKRIEDDYNRLNEILSEHNPKIKIVSTMACVLDQQGKVFDVYMTSTKGKDSLTPEMKQIILDLLKEKQFYAYEARGYLSKGDKVNEDMRTRRQRRGPLD